MESDAKTQLTGLPATEAARRLTQYGPNRVSYDRHSSLILQFIATFNNPLTLLLVAVAIISAFLGAGASAVIILIVVGISVCLDFSNSFRSAHAAQALEAQVRTTATVIRDRQDLETPLDNLVVGDLIRLTPGKIVPADAKISATKDLYLDESALTGEAFPQPKELGAAIYMGSSVVSGSGLATITATGAKTRFNQLAASLTSHEQTDFDRGIQAFSHLILRLVIMLTLFVFVANTVLHGNLLESLLFAVALAVGMTPELLPMIITLNLTRGALSMQQHGVIVKKLSAIQNFGSMNILCTDKTGTLTENHIALIKAVNSQGQESEEVLRYGYLHSVYEMGVDNPLDAAVKRHGAMDIRGWHKLDEYPFDYTRKCSSILVGHGSKSILITKGAAEEIIAKCTHDGLHRQILTGQQREVIHAEYQRLSADGFRVLALAMQPSYHLRQPIQKQEVGLSFIGFLAFLDPAKAGVETTLRLIEEHGIEIKILTGDNELVSQRIADEIHLPVKGVLTGPEIDQLPMEKFAQAVEATTIFARLTPEQKLRTIHALRGNGHVVGYMGDGINDAPSIKAADVGISVNNAVDVAKETADIILLKHSLHQLINGVIEGRKTFVNTSKYLMMAISSNFGNMLSMAAASVFLPFLPMLPTQILLNNLIYDTSQLALPFDSVDPADVKTPRKWDLAFLKHTMVVLGPLSSLYDFLTFGVLIWGLHLAEAGFQTGWFIESIVTQVLVVFVIRTRRPHLSKSRPSVALIASALGAVAISFFIIFSPLGHYFGFVYPTAWQTIILAAIIVAYLISTNLVRLRLFGLRGQAVTIKTAR